MTLKDGKLSRSFTVSLERDPGNRGMEGCRSHCKLPSRKATPTHGGFSKVFISLFASSRYFLCFEASNSPFVYPTWPDRLLTLPLVQLLPAERASGLWVNKAQRLESEKASDGWGICLPGGFWTEKKALLLQPHEPRQSRECHGYSHSAPSAGWPAT